ncbi:MAG TPA: transposase [Terriglobia bacterium]|nr:transposase [Terriglobia bacterium]
MSYCYWRYTGPVRFQRKNIRLPASSYIGRQWYYLTACTQGRVPRFRDARLVAENLELLSVRAKDLRFEVHAYCFMPDHLHLLASGSDDQSDCLTFINRFKQVSGFKFKQATGQRLWQHKSYDHILRPGERWEAVAYYIWMNPVRKGLCGQPDEWPFSGSETIDWRRLMATPQGRWIPSWKD